MEHASRLGAKAFVGCYGSYGKETYNTWCSGISRDNIVEIQSCILQFHTTGASVFFQHK